MMNDWDSLLEHFRELGGIADNIMLSIGDYGRGLFPIDPNLPVKLVVPKNLLLPVDWLQLDENHQIKLSDKCDWIDEKKKFYLDYLCKFGVSSDVKREIIEQQEAYFHLPESVKSMLKGFGMRDSQFDKPNSANWLDNYKNSRMIRFDDHLFLMSLLELVNYDGKSKLGFSKKENISISGKFSGEILVNYHIAGDATSMYETYGFSTLKPYAFSGALAINIGSKVIKIARYINLYNKIDNTNIPKISVQGNEINLSFLVVGSLNDRSSPKKIFVKLMQEVGMPIHMAGNVFDGIVNMNKQFFNNLLNELEPLEGLVANGLRTMARNQLTAIRDN